jgi:hypothetical protein
VTARLDARGRVTAVTSTAPRHRALGMAPGSRLRAGTRAFGGGVRGRRARGGTVLVGVRGGRVRWVGATTARSRAAVKRSLGR